MPVTKCHVGDSRCARVSEVTLVAGCVKDVLAGIENSLFLSLLTGDSRCARVSEVTLVAGCVKDILAGIANSLFSSLLTGYS
ncbi:hypothetical protein CCACVL1_30793 [Corchorus capsularis]|uniref:Uncharacterized protein n=1 Tax=Corchorus capsularis TaxID=210143 RepID=A0A1R3FVG2_COCAP|nr:hypothetical protein CCACVL1_30793 [Corchorus capsularis]